MNKTQKTIRLIVEIGLFAAIGFVLDEIQGAIFGAVFPSGGSIGIAMLPILIIGIRRGGIAGVAVGLIMGLFDMATKAYLYNGLQVMCDYVLPYALVGVMGFFKPLIDKSESIGHKMLWISVGTLIGGTLKLISHYIAGVTLWVPLFGYSWKLEYMGPYLYSFLYNLAAIGPSVVICLAVVTAMIFKVPSIFQLSKDDIKVTDQDKKIQPIICTSFVSAAGIFLFVFFLIRYINSYNWEAEYNNASFDLNATVMWVIGLLTILLALYLTFTIIKERWKYSNLFIGEAVISAAVAAHFLSRIIEMYIEKESINNLNWLYFSISFALTAIFAILGILTLQRENQKKKAIEAN